MMASPSSSSSPEPPDTPGAVASMRARLYAVLDGGGLGLVAELQVCSSPGEGGEMRAAEPAAAAGARPGDLLFVVLQEERALYASFLSFVKEPWRAEREKVGTGDEGEDGDEAVVFSSPLQHASDKQCHEYSVKLRVWPRSFLLDLVLFGKGASCNAHQAVYHLDNNDYTIKVIKLRKEIQDEPREVAILSSLRGPYIVKFSQAWVGSLYDLKYEDCSESGSSERGKSWQVSEGSSARTRPRSISSTRFTESEGSSAHAWLRSLNDLKYEGCSESDSFERGKSWQDSEGSSARTSSRSSSRFTESEESSANVCLDSSSSNADLQYGKYLYIQLEFCPRTLEEYLFFGKRNVDAQESELIFLEMVKGLKDIHDAGIIHRDLKPANVFFGPDGSIRISDFGHACFRPNHCTMFDGTPNRGTMLYAAPELEAGLDTSEKVDIYSLGATYIRLFHSFWTESEMVKTFLYYQEKDSSTECTGDLAFFSQMISKDPSERPTVAEILDHLTK